MAKAKKPVAKKRATKKPVAKKATKKKPIKKKSKDMVVHNPTNPSQEFIVACEFADEEAVEGELLGKAMEHYVYEFCDYKGNKVTGMTVAGVNETCRLLTKKKDSGLKIRIVPDSVKIDTDATMGGVKGVSVTLMGENMLTGETSIGAKFEPFQKKGKNGMYDNTFTLEKAVSKSERNAKRKLIPEKLAVETIRKFMKNSNNVQQLNTPQAPPQRQVASPVTPQGVNYLSKLIAMLAKECNVNIINGIPTKDQLEIMIEVYNTYTGQNIKGLKVEQSTAQKYILDFINSPTIITNQK